MRCVALAGGSGFVGEGLRRHWARQGVEVVRLVRRAAAGPAEVEWDPEGGRLDTARLARCDSLVNLAGENIAAGRWTDARQARIRGSRVGTTALLAAAIEAGAWRPGVWINASAVGFYGDGGEREFDERSPQGAGFLASVCGDWEAATRPALAVGVRVVCLRLGVVLDPAGGMLARLAPVFRAGLGGPLGEGRAWMSWLTLDELCRAVDFIRAHETIVGPVNATRPDPVRNADFTAALAAALGRPALVRTPAWLVRAVFGQMGREVLLAGQRAMPGVLAGHGFEFAPGTVATVLGTQLGRRSS